MEETRPDIAQQIADIGKKRELLEIEQRLLIEKGMQSGAPEEILKAHLAWKDIQEKKDSNSKSFLFDPFNFNNAYGYKQRPTALSYAMLRNMAKTPIVSAVIGTRVEQIASFAEPVNDPTELGFMIKKKSIGMSEEDAKVSKQEQTRIQLLTEFVLNCGVDQNKWLHDSFEVFLRKFTQDSLILDQATFEVVRANNGLPVEFFATDGATYRYADNTPRDHDVTNMALSPDFRANRKMESEKVNGYLPEYVQVYNNNIVAEFYPWELCFGIRNQTTDIRYNGYGVSELELLVNQVTWMLYGDAYNGKFFSQGAAPKGILKVSGALNPSKLQEFRQQWIAQIAGVNNSWKTPVLEGDKVDWIDLHKNNRDMEFGKWQEYLIRVTCAIFKIDPSEIGFKMEGMQGGSSLFEGNNESRLKHSKDKGLRPMLRFLQRKINKYIINPIDPNYEFVFTGLEYDEETELKRDIEKIGSFMTLKEIRRKWKLDENIDEDDMILNAVWMQNQQRKDMAAMGGGFESNAVMDEEYGEGSNPNPFVGTGEDDDDPFAKALEESLKKLN